MKLLLNAAFNTKVPVGIARYLRCLVPHLSRLCKLTVLTPDPELFADDCEVIRIPDLTHSSNRQVIWVITSLRGYCTKMYDVLLSATPVVPPMVRIPTVAIVHDLIPLVMNQFHRARDKTTFWLGLQTLRWADAVVAVSKYTKMDLARLKLVPTKRIHVVSEGPGLLPSSQRRSLAQRLRPYILYVGGHPLHKNVTRLVAAFARLRTKGNLRLILVGGGHPKHVAVTKNAIRKYQLKDRVTLLQDLSDEQLSSLYQECKLFVCPSLYEGFGLPVLEAMAHSAPVACSSTSSIPEVASDAAVYFNPMLVDQIAGKIQLLLDRPDLRARLRERGLERAKQFSWEKTARGIYKCARALVARCTR
ncbi:hypothetical protein CH330_08690 [candidate division WOR-3 bacterium JGI_Cruoil_03_51_56]|uniref:Glycosyl transferase family 1 domain-containing protein n=1 Tax=candidate division WOR-3 bacterium JGI_Cruoil_03_51_56 TaxID=1973747 RepID=A0A235BQB7_UNCW3|nr:MAG: hypothetical protein CH330_08690 [candidate division WOR-3 bacterium JGI_Cruoil_03_51_56]